MVPLVLYTQSGLSIMPNRLAEQIDALAAFAHTALPVVSPQLNTQSGDHTRVGTFTPQSAARASFQRAVAGIQKYLPTLAQARQTEARFRLIEDARLLANVGGFGVKREQLCHSGFTLSASLS